MIFFTAKHTMSSLNNNSNHSSNSNPCSLPTLQRQQCHMIHGIQNEECIREELSEKRCLAELHCRTEALRFYTTEAKPSSTSSRRRWSCSAYIERFAFPENELMLPENIEKSDREYCRRVVYDLARCLSKHGIGR